MGFFSRRKQKETKEDDSRDTVDNDSSSVDDSENSHAEPPEPEPIDTHAFVEDMRRKSEEIALGVANRLAERMDGIVEPIHPSSETGTTTFFANPRAYSICNGSTKVVLFVRPYEKNFRYDINSDSNLTPYQQSVRDTKQKIYKMDIRWFKLSLESDGSLSWNEFSNNVIWGSYNYVRNFEFGSYRNCQW